MTQPGDIITIFGGSGFIGRYLVRALCKKDYRVRVATRRPHLAGDVRVAGVPGQVQIVQANIRDDASVRAAVDGADGVVNLVGILYQHDKQRFTPVQAEGPKRIAEHSAAAGAKSLVHISAIGADPLSESVYAASKGSGEVNVQTAFPDAVVLRPSIVFGPEDQFFNRFANIFRYAPAFPLFGAKTKFQPIYVADVADAIVAALESPAAPGRVFALGGPTVYTFKELMALIKHEIDRSCVLLPTPFAFAKALGLAGEVAGALPFVEPFLTRDQVELMKTDNVAVADDGVGVLADLGITPESVEAIIPTYLWRYRKGGQFHEGPGARAAQTDS